jgi:hypothetical protein
MGCDQHVVEEDAVGEAAATRGRRHRRAQVGHGVREAEDQRVRFCRYRFAATGFNSKATWFGI